VTYEALALASSCANYSQLDMWLCICGRCRKRTGTLKHCSQCGVLVGVPPEVRGVVPVLGQNRWYDDI
jgi:hypothetical protein